MSMGSSSNHKRINFLQSLRGKLLLIFLALSILPLITISLISYIQSQNALKDRIKADLTAVTQLQEIMLRDFLAQRKDNVVVLAGTARVRTMDPAKVGDAIDQYFKQWGVYENMGLYTPDGNTLYRTDQASINIADRDYFQKALAGETTISDPVPSKATGNIVFVVATPVIEKEKVVGVVTGSIPTKVFAEILSASDVGSGDAYLINKAGVLITPSNHTDELLKTGIIKERTELELTAKTLAAKNVLAGENRCG